MSPSRMRFLKWLLPVLIVLLSLGVWQYQRVDRGRVVWRGPKQPRPERPLSSRFWRGRWRSTS